MNKEVIGILATALSLNVEELTQAIAAEDKADFKLPENLKVMTTEKLEELKDNHGKSRYDAGKTAGTEMLLKDLSEKAGFETPIKDATSFLDSYKKNVIEQAKIEPNTKIDELNTTIENLRNKIQEKDGEFANLKSSMESQRRTLEIQSAMPDIPENLGISKAEATSLYMQGREFKEDGIYLNGKKLTDDVERAIDVTTDVKSWYEGKGWGKTPKGRGGGPKGKGGDFVPQSMEEYKQLLDQKGIQEGSMEANAILRDIAEKNPEILDVT